MKNLTINIFLVLGLIILNGCKDSFDGTSNLYPDLTGQYLLVSNTNFTHSSADAFEDNFDVESSGTSWQFTLPANWIHLSQSYGDSSSSIRMDGDENTSGDGRTSVFYLESAESALNLSKGMSVSQGGVEPTLSIDRTNLSFSGKGGETIVTVIANCEWNAKCLAEWVSLSTVGSNDLNVSVTENPSEEYRQTTVYLNYGDAKTIPISVTQYPSSISSSEAFLKFPNVASKYNITITSEVAWEASVSDNWLSITPQFGMAGETIVSIEAAPNTSVNERFGYIAFSTGEQERFQIQIQQDGLFLETEDKITFRSLQSSQEITVKSNTSWEVLSAPKWVSCSPSSGTGTSQLQLTVSDNDSLDSREGTIIIGQKGLSLSCEIKVVQSGRTLAPGTLLLEFSDKAGQLDFELQSDGPWSSTCSEEWFFATPVSGNGDHSITVTVDENKDYSSRSGRLSYSFGSQTKDVEVKQEGKYFQIENTSLDFSSKGGEHTLFLTTNESWKAEIPGNPGWVSLSGFSGNGDKEIQIKVSDNPSVNPRSADIIITPANGQGISIKVAQAARTLSVSAESILFYSAGGVSEYVAITTDGTYSIDCDSSWIQIKEESGGFFVECEKYREPESRSAKIVISLTDLKEGSLSLQLAVIQIGEGCSFIVNGYPEDQNWSDFGNSTLSFSITTFTTDQSWDSTQEPTISIQIQGFNTTHDWNSKENEDLDFKLEGYDSEGDSWNTTEKEEIDFNIDQYGDEENWNTDQEAESDFEVTDYTPDINWN